jgi:hypothetical protein
MIVEINDIDQIRKEMLISSILGFKVIIHKKDSASMPCAEKRSKFTYEKQSSPNILPKKNMMHK